jgi:hydroxypyruvate reductase
MTDAPALLRAVFDAAVRAADPAAVLARHLPEKPEGRCLVPGAGKAAAVMARAVEDAWPDVDLSGLVVTRYGQAVPTWRIAVREAAHPVPDAAGMAAAEEILALAEGARDGDLVLVLISGGGSSLLPLPCPPLTLEDEIATGRALLRSGLSIADMNRVRRRLGRIRDGGLARAARPARVATLAISDAPGDVPADIASGPTVPDPSPGDDLSALADRLRDLPAAVRAALKAPPEPPPGFEIDYRLIATPMMALEAVPKWPATLGQLP